MKRLIQVSLVILTTILMVSAVSCSATKATPISDDNSNNSTVNVIVSYDELMAQKMVTKTIEFNHPDSLVVTLASNASTGYSWTEQAQISDSSVVHQTKHEYLEPQSSNPPVVGAAGNEVWTFNTLGKGTTTIQMSYNQPWQGGQKGAWTFTLNVTVI